MYTRGPLPCETMPRLRQPGRNSPVRPPPRWIGIRLGTTFSRSRLDAPESVAEAQLSNQYEKQADRGPIEFKNMK
jgi:hypothetical protein